MRRKKLIGNERKAFPPPLIAELLNSLTTNWPERLKSTKHIPRVHVLSGERSKHQRTYRCSKCGYGAPRDVVGCLNIRTKGIHGSLLPGQSKPSKIIFKYPEKFSGSSPGHGASSSESIREAPHF